MIRGGLPPAGAPPRWVTQDDRLAVPPRNLTHADIEAWCEHPEQGTLRVSPQFLLELLDSEWHRPDGSVVRIIGVMQYPDGEVAVTFHKVTPQ